MVNGIPTTEIVLLVLFFIGAREFWFKMDINMINNHIYSSVYFLFWSTVLFLVFEPWLAGLVSDFNVVPIIVLALLFLISWFTYYLLKHKLKPPKKLIKRYPKERFLTLSYRYLFSKSFDILFQQMAVVIAIIMLSKAGISFTTLTIGFALVFGFLHARIVQKEGNIGWIYVIASTFAGLIFPFIILNIDYGFVYTYILHWMYYLLLGVYFWIKSQRQIET